MAAFGGVQREVPLAVNHAFRVPVARWGAVCLVWLWVCGGAWAQPQELVDRLSERVGSELTEGGPGTFAGALGGEASREVEVAQERERRITAVAAKVGGPDRITLTVEMGGEGARLLLVDAGALFVTPEGMGLAAIPNQRFVVEQARMELSLEAVPIDPGTAWPAEGTRLSATWSNDPGLIAVLRMVQHVESVDVGRLSRYVKEKPDGSLGVETFVDNRDVRLARTMGWSRNVAGVIEARVPRDAVRFAVYAVTAGFTIQEVADWLRQYRKMEMEAAVDLARELVPQVEYLLERAGLEHRVFSHEHAEFHYNRGVEAYRRGDLAAAEKYFRKAVSVRPDFLLAHYNVAVTLYRSGAYDKAADTLLVASGFPLATADIFYNRGAVLYRLDRKLDAAKAFRRALELNPRDTKAEEWLKRADPEDETAPPPPPQPRKGRKGKRPAKPKQRRR